MTEINETKDYLASNVVSEERTKKEIRDTIHTISEILSKTLGPYGSTTILQDKTLRHTQSKDGFTVFKKIYFRDEIPRTTLDIIKQISEKLVRSVGDGSTSSVIIADKLFSNLDNLMNEFNVAPKDITHGLNKLAVKLEEMIKDVAIKDEDNLEAMLTKVATISTNNDDELGEMISKAFLEIGKFGFANIEHSPTNESYYEVDTGMEVKRGYILPEFINKGNETCEYEDSLVFISNDVLDDDDMEMVGEILGWAISEGKAITIIAPDYSSSMKAFFQQNKRNNEEYLKLLVIDMANKSRRAKNKFQDFALLTGSDIYDKMNEQSLKEFIGFNGKTISTENFGSVDKVVSSENSTKFITEVDTEDEYIKERIEYLKEDLVKLETDYGHIDRDVQIYECKQRIANLEGKMAKIFIGGNSESEKIIIKDLVEDAVYACKSAIEYGYITGGNITVPRIIKSRMEELSEYLIGEFSYMNNRKNIDVESFVVMLILHIDDAFKYSFDKVLDNANFTQEEKDEVIKKCVDTDLFYNLKTNEYESIHETNVINSAQTDIEIVKSTFSIIGHLVTSSQIITLNVNN